MFPLSRIQFLKFAAVGTLAGPLRNPNTCRRAGPKFGTGRTPRAHYHDDWQ